MRRLFQVLSLVASGALALLPAGEVAADDPPLAAAAPPGVAPPPDTDEAAAAPGDDEVAPVPSRAPHPEPRVIVAVQKVRGAHDRGAVERAARLGWGRIVSCHKAASARGVEARGTIKLRLEVSAGGAVKGAKRLASELDPEVSRCLLRAMRKVAMPRARKGSTVEASIRVAPGDKD